MGSSLENASSRHADEFKCRKCGARGVIHWDGGQFVELSGGFYERLARKAPYPIELVCHQCGTAQREADLYPNKLIVDQQDARFGEDN